jgi:hypothetical protein
MLQKYYLAVSKLERTQFLYEMSFTVNKRKIHESRENEVLEGQ